MQGAGKILSSVVVEILMNRSLIFALGLLAAPVSAYEGKWTPQQVLQLREQELLKLGLKVPAKRLWDPEKGTGLLAGAVWVNGCSGAFVSETGLLITNHHCLFSILQQHSSPERDLMKTGFLASSQAEELPGLTERVRVPHRFTDVSKQIAAAIPKDAADAARHRAIEQKKKELVAECEKTRGSRCEVATFDGGSWFTLVETKELLDVRLVYAPPRALGEFGGETDNWQWPRHAADFAIARIYAGRDGEPSSYWEHNLPYKPQHYFPIATDGIRPDDFVMVMGYPRKTDRSLIAAEVAERAELLFPARQTVYGEWSKLMEDATAKDAAGRIAVADDVRQLHNRAKQASGMLAAFARMNLTERHRTQEQEAIRWGAQRRGWDEALRSREELEAVVQKHRPGFMRDFLLEHLKVERSVFEKSLYLATTLVRHARARTKPDLERDEDFQERNVPALRDQLEREQKRLYLPSERAVLLSYVRRALALPKDQRIFGIDATFGQVSAEALPQAVDALLAGTKVLDLTERMKMFKETEPQLRARKDPLIELGAKLADDLDLYKARREALEGAGTRLRPQWRRLVAAHQARELDPDANGTLRVSFARVKGYAPADGVYFTPQSTLKGMFAKASAKGAKEESFTVPASIRQAAAEQRYGRWKDAALGDVPVNFLSDADTSNGNSGSPVVNARGQLVGVNFDRVWENIGNDFGYNPAVARNISADVRCLLWILDDVLDADALLVELGVRKRINMRRGAAK